MLILVAYPPPPLGAVKAPRASHHRPRPPPCQVLAAVTAAHWDGCVSTNRTVAPMRFIGRRSQQQQQKSQLLLWLWDVATCLSKSESPQNGLSFGPWDDLFPNYWNKIKSRTSWSRLSHQNQHGVLPFFQAGFFSIYFFLRWLQLEH